MWGYSESRCQKVNEKLSIVFCWGIKIFRVGDVFFSFLPAAEVEHKTTGLHGLACLVQVWLDFIWKIRKSLSSYPNKHHLALSFTVQKWRWLPRATLRSKFNCPIIVRVLPTNIFFSWKKYTFFFFAIFGLLEMDTREIYCRTLFGLEDPFVQVHSSLIGLCSCCNPQPGILRGGTHFLLSHISIVITFGCKPATIYMFNKNITPIPYSKLFFLLV